MTAKQDRERSAGSKRRTRMAQFMAIVVVVLLVLVTVVGCAKYDGDQAAFCERLTEIPSFADLSTRVNDGSAAAAAAQMHKAAATFRSLERVAPRSIRQDVAALGDSADRIAGRIKSESSEESQVVHLRQTDGTTITIPVQRSTSQVRLEAFYNEFNDHHGTVSSMYDLVTYARNDCGMGDQGPDLGMAGYGPTGRSGVQNPFEGSGVAPGVVVPPDERVPVTPPRGAEPVPPPGGPTPSTMPPASSIMPPATTTP